MSLAFDEPVDTRSGRRISSGERDARVEVRRLTRDGEVGGLVGRTAPSEQRRLATWNWLPTLSKDAGLGQALRPW